jgi:lisH domain-containing protein FOPNL
MASLQELKDALRDTLAARGSLGQIQARVRAEIFHALEESVMETSFPFLAFLRPITSF